MKSRSNFQKKTHNMETTQTPSNWRRDPFTVAKLYSGSLHTTYQYIKLATDKVGMNAFHME